MQKNSKRSNVIAGSFLIGAIALAIGTSVVLSGVEERLIPTHVYDLRFAVAEGAPGLKAGSNVLLGGVKIGRVTGVRIVRETDGPMLSVGIRVRTSVQLHQDAVILLERPLLGTGSEINIVGVGGQAPVLTPGSTIHADIAPPAFLAQAGYGPEQASQVRRAITQMTELVDRIDTLSRSVEPKVEPIVDSMAAAVEDVRQLTASIAGRREAWAGSVDRILGSAETTSKRAEQVVADVGQGVTESRELVASAHAAIADSRPTFDRILSNVDSITAKVDQETITSFNRALASADQGVQRLTAAAEEISTLIREESPSLRRAMANARLASDQLKLATIEIRRSPWRLLYQPTKKELETELIYGAAEAYAQAVSDLRAASETLSVSASRTGVATDAARLEELTRELDAAFDRYKVAEEEFLRRFAPEAHDPAAPR